MVNETIPTSIQWVDKWANQLPIWPANPLDLVNKEAKQIGDKLWTVFHKGIIGNFVWLIAKVAWYPDPFTWKGGSPVVIKPEVKIENQTNTPTIQTEDSWLFGKFTGIMWNIWNKVEIAWEKAIDKATGAMNKWLETAEKVWEQAINKAQEVAIETTSNITWTLTDFVKLEDPKKDEVIVKNIEWTASIPVDFFPKDHNNSTTTEQKAA